MRKTAAKVKRVFLIRPMCNYTARWPDGGAVEQPISFAEGFRRSANRLRNSFRRRLIGCDNQSAGSIFLAPAESDWLLMTEDAHLSLLYFHFL